MTVSYRTRQTLRRAFSVVGIMLAVTAAILLCLTVWLHRFVVYTDEGAILDFGRRDESAAVRPQVPEALPSVSVTYGDSPFQEGLQQLSGYYITKADLADPQAVLEKVKLLPAGTTVMLDVKGYRGYCYYSTALGESYGQSKLDVKGVDELIAYLAQSDLYTVARMSSLWDFVTVWNDSSYGLTTASHTLYSDNGDAGSGESGIGYWLDPTLAATQNYLAGVINELKSLGFDEVVLDNFHFPNTENLSFSGDRGEALAQCALALTQACAGKDFVVSFCTDDPTFALPSEQSRLYLKNIAPESAQNAWEQATVADKRTGLVFLAVGGDTRYDIENGILQQLI